MDVDELRRQQEAARAFMEEEGRRLSEATRPGEGTGRRGQRYRNADGDGEEDGDAESEPDKKRRLLETLRQDFPSLNHWPDSYILQQSASGLTKAHAEMENRSGRGGRPSLETRMARNFKISNGRKIQLPAGEDDRATVIHEGRFLPGLLCTIGETFRAAKGVLPERGHDPVAHYDARGLGLGYLVSAKAWAAVHDPGCTDINLGMFTHAAGAAGNSDYNTKFKCEDLDEFKQTLSHARAVQQLVTPWNYSITAIHLYLENIKWGYRHFTNQKDHIKGLTGFVDQALLANATNWQLGLPCLNAAELKQAWDLYVAGRGGDNRTQYSGNRRRSPSPSSRDRTRRWEKLSEGAICGRYNAGICPNKDDSCRLRGFNLRHRCSYVLKNGKQCEEKHPEKDHK